MQNLKLGDYVHVFKKNDDQFYGTVNDLVTDNGTVSIAVIKVEGGVGYRLAFPRNRITLVNMIEANE